MNFIILEGPVTFVFDVKKRVRKMINELKATLVISTFASDVFKKKKKKDEMKRNVGKKENTRKNLKWNERNNNTVPSTSQSLFIKHHYRSLIRRKY